MRYVEIKGGLGNQLFQYTFYRYLEKETSENALLYTNFFDSVKKVEAATKRCLKLDRFCTDYIAVKGNITCSSIISESEISGQQPWPRGAFFSGYWQDKKYYEVVADEIKNELKLKEAFVSKELKNVAQELSNCNSVALHIRRGDYLSAENRKIFEELDLDFYKRALLEVETKFGDNLKIFIFSDDTEYAKEVSSLLGDYDTAVMPAREDYEDIFLMTFARHHVIANSSFSWWGAALAKHKDGLTVAPGNWYIDRPSPNLYLGNWILI